MGGGKGPGLLHVAVGHALYAAAGKRQGVRHLVGDDPTADDGPPELGRAKDVGRKLPAEGGLVGGLGKAGGVKRAFGLGHGLLPSC